MRIHRMLVDFGPRIPVMLDEKMERIRLLRNADFLDSLWHAHKPLPANLQSLLSARVTFLAWRHAVLEVTCHGLKGVYSIDNLITTHEDRVQLIQSSQEVVNEAIQLLKMYEMCRDREAANHCILNILKLDIMIFFQLDFLTVGDVRRMQPGLFE
ncbi:hypothetical protein KBC70_03005 [Candidatus Woesebacteria bacterium]|nr:hypothetical protein [Candidatus Woesebacteria bacterium]